MSTSTINTALEKHRLPVIFNGSTVIHKYPTEVEEHWLQRCVIGKGGFGEIWLQSQAMGPGKVSKYRAVKKLAQVVRGVDFRRELNIFASLVDVWASLQIIPVIEG